MFDSPLHDDQEALLPIVCVLVHVLDVDDVPAAAGPPVQVDLPPTLDIVLQNLERALLARAVETLHHLPIDPEPENIGADLVIFRNRIWLDHQRAAGCA